MRFHPPTSGDGCGGTFPVGRVVVGRNFRFWPRSRRGTAGMISLPGRGLPAEAVELLTYGGLRLSSTEVHPHLVHGGGHAALARRRSWASPVVLLGGPVVHWRAERPGFPANVDLSRR